MRVIKNERVVFFDVDKTLLLDSTNGLDTVRVNDPYRGTIVLRDVHAPHVRLLVNYIARDFKVYVWSKNGYRWAAEAVRALKLDHLNIEVLTKPCVIVDDEPPENWIGEQVFIPANSSFGRD